MTNNPSWGLMQRKLLATMDLYPQLMGVQVMNDMGDYLFSSTRREWMQDTEETRERIITAVRLWNPYSNSSPVEGIEEAVSNLPAADGSISIYVLGDDFQPDGSIDEVAARVDRLNSQGSDSSRRARIHTIMFPTIFAGPARYRGSADNYIALMRSIAQRSGGTFEILADFQ
jgi:predicted RecB family endonuclease